MLPRALRERARECAKGVWKMAMNSSKPGADWGVHADEGAEAAEERSKPVHCWRYPSNAMISFGAMLSVNALKTEESVRGRARAVRGVVEKSWGFMKKRPEMATMGRRRCPMMFA